MKTFSLSRIYYFVLFAQLKWLCKFFSTPFGGLGLPGPSGSAYVTSTTLSVAIPDTKILAVQFFAVCCGSAIKQKCLKKWIGSA